MLFQKLQNIIPGFEFFKPQSASISGYKILVEESNFCTGEWIINSLLENFIRQAQSDQQEQNECENKVVFVASQQSYSHYLAVLKKMSGINLQSSIDQGQLAYIDAFSQPFTSNSFQNLPISTSIPNTYCLKVPKNMKKFSCDPNKQYFDLEKKENTMFSIFVQNFIQEIQNSIQYLRKESARKTRIIIIIDSITSLVQGWDSSCPDIDFLELMNSLQDLTNDGYGQNKNILAISINKNLLFGNQSILYKEIKQNDFNLIFELKRNEAGYNYKDVHGQLNVIISMMSQSLDNPELLQRIDQLQSSKQVRFKLCENKIEVFEHLQI